MKLNRQSKRVCDTSPKFEISVVLYVVTLLWRPTNTRLIYSPIDKGTICGFQTLINRLWPGDAIWRHRTWSALVQIMACCPTSPSHYMKQLWLIISEVFRPSPDMRLKITHLRSQSHFPGAKSMHSHIEWERSSAWDVKITRRVLFFLESKPWTYIALSTDITVTSYGVRHLDHRQLDDVLRLKQYKTSKLRIISPLWEKPPVNPSDRKVGDIRMSWHHNK